MLDGGVSGISTYVLSLLKALIEVDKTNQYEIFLPSQVQNLLPVLGERFKARPSSSLVNNPIANILWHNSVLPTVSAWGKFDLVHIPSIRRIPLIKGCPLVATVHDMAPCGMPEKYDAFRWFYHQHVLGRIIHRCERIIAVSHHTKGDIIKYTGYP